jgi:hypothetical protein
VTPEQFTQLIALLSKLADKPFALTNASDWPILVVVGGLLISAIGVMWLDLRSTIKDGREEWREELKEVRADFRADDNNIWKAMRNCQEDCCIGVKKHSQQ